MKVLLHYEDNEDTELWKSLKITLPKSWRTGPTSQVLGQFVESYNGNATFQERNPLELANVHLAIRQRNSKDGSSSQLQPLASDAIVCDCIPDRADVYVRHGIAPTLQEQQAATTSMDVEASTTSTDQTSKAATTATATATVQCTRLGCQKRFPKGGPYPTTPCLYHKSPPVFHETAKFWSCCPHKKVYDWDDFQAIPGCCTADTCTDIKEASQQKLFLGGMDLREPTDGAVKLKSIDDFNKSLAAGGADAAPVLDRLSSVLIEMGIERELLDQVVNGIRQDFLGSSSSDTNNNTSNNIDEVAILEAVKTELGNHFKACLKSIAAEQLRIK